MNPPTTPATMDATTLNGDPSPGYNDTLNGHTDFDTHGPHSVEGQASPATIVLAPPTTRSSRGSETADRHQALDAHMVRAVGADFPTRHHAIDTQYASADGEQTGRDQHTSGTHRLAVSATDAAATIKLSAPNDAASLPSAEQGPQANEMASPIRPPLADPLLALAADVLDDLEKVRIANENRLRQLTRSETDSDGEERGFGLDGSHPDVARLAALVDMLAKAEHQAELNLRRQLRKHPLGPWVKQARGVGEKQAARLLASIGDPYWNFLHDRPRTVSELWAYCGYHVLPARQAASDDQSSSAGGAQLGSNPDRRIRDTHTASVGVAATRVRGQKANWSAAAKMRSYLVAVSIVKAGGPYRAVYDKARAKYEDATHQVECKRCGPSGRPAQPGTSLSAGHQHARAVRIVAKEVLKDLWREAKRIHELGGSQAAGELHRSPAPV